MTNISSGDGSQAASLGLWQDVHLKELNISADYYMFHSQAGARNTVDTNNNADDEGSLCAPATSTTTSPKTSASFVSSSLTTRVSLLSLSDKSTVDVVGNRLRYWALLFVTLHSASSDLVDFGALEWDALCARMTATIGVEAGSNRTY